MSKRKNGGAFRLDGWVNALTGIGLAARDKRLSTDFTPDLLSREMLENIWRGDDMAARVVETIPNETLREGFEIKIQADDATPGTTDAIGANKKAKEHAEGVMHSMTALEVHDRLLEAQTFERAYGGSAILLGVNDGETDLSKPLNPERIKSFDWLTVLGSFELTPVRYYGDPLAPKFGQPEVYRIHPEAPVASSLSVLVEVHESRMILFKGIKVSRRQMRANNGWGDSVLVRCNRVLADFHQSWGGAAILLQDFAGAVLKIKDLADLIASNDDETIIKRAQAMEMSRSIARATIIDSEEEYERKVTPMTGLPEMLDKFALRLASAADMPVTLLMGQAPAGLNATGASDIRFFYDRVAARQRTKLLPAVKRIAELVMLSKAGPTRGTVPANWSVCFNPLWQLSEGEKADVRLKQSQADVAYIDRGVVSPEEVAVSRFGGDAYSVETVIDFEGRKPFEVPAKPGMPPGGAGAREPGKPPPSPGKPATVPGEGET